MPQPHSNNKTEKADVLNGLSGFTLPHELSAVAHAYGIALANTTSATLMPQDTLNADQVFNTAKTIVLNAGHVMDEAVQCVRGMMEENNC